jgi:phosphatidylinositol alpha-1,6-mannosyltransferase
VSERFENVLVVGPEFGVGEDGSYRPGGLAQFSRCVLQVLASSKAVGRLTAWGLLDKQAGLEWMQGNYFAADPNRQRPVDVRGFDADRRRMALTFARAHRQYDLVMFLHIGVGRLAALRPLGRTSLWLVGIEVRRKLRWYERFAVQRADPLLSISTFSSDEMRRHNPSLRAATTVHLCAEPDAPWLGTGIQPAELGGYSAAARKSAVMIVARQAASERYKGHDELIECWPSVIAAVPDAELWIVGTGDDEPRLQAKARAAGPEVERRIRFQGKVSHERLLKLYAEARVFAMPSTGEGFGLVFVEAMRYGMPCICSRDSSAEIVVDEKTGLVVSQAPGEIATACIRLLTDFELANKMSLAGRQRFEQEFTLEGMRGRLLRALNIAG